MTITAAQQRVLDLLCEGKSNKVIAHELGLSPLTVPCHVSAIFRKLGVTNRTQAVLKTIGDQ
jgi:DNA-binding NarL/FixJ family response regulator